MFVSVLFFGPFAEAFRSTPAKRFIRYLNYRAGTEQCNGILFDTSRNGLRVKYEKKNKRVMTKQKHFVECIVIRIVASLRVVISCEHMRVCV